MESHFSCQSFPTLVVLHIGIEALYQIAIAPVPVGGGEKENLKN